CESRGELPGRSNAGALSCRGSYPREPLRLQVRMNKPANGVRFHQVVKQGLVAVVIAVNAAFEFHVDHLTLGTKSHRHDVRARDRLALDWFLVLICRHFRNAFLLRLGGRGCERAAAEPYASPTM